MCRGFHYASLLGPRYSAILFKGRLYDMSNFECILKSPLRNRCSLSKNMQVNNGSAESFNNKNGSNIIIINVNCNNF